MQTNGWAVRATMILIVEVTSQKGRGTLNTTISNQLREQWIINKFFLLLHYLMSQKSIQQRVTKYKYKTKKELSDYTSHM